MSQNGVELSDEPVGYAQEMDSYGSVTDRGILPTVLAWLLALIAFMWIAASLWYINRVIGWQTIPQLLPNELGGLIAGVLTPPAVLFALAAWAVRDQQMSYDIAVLEQQIWRMEKSASPWRRSVWGKWGMGC